MTTISIKGQDFVLLRREPEDGGPRAGKADQIWLRKPKGKAVLLSWDWGPGRGNRYETPFKVGDDATTFFSGSEEPRPALFPDSPVETPR